MIGNKMRETCGLLLQAARLTQEQIKGWILHPGGSRLLSNIEEALGLTKEDTQPSWDILGNVGNLSSATILFILQEWLEKASAGTRRSGFCRRVRPGLQR